MIKYMEDYLSEIHRHKDVFSRFRANKSTKKVAEALRKQLAIDMQHERENDPVWSSLLQRQNVTCASTRTKFKSIQK